MDERFVEEIVAEHRGSFGAMLSILGEVQSKYGYLPREALGIVAAATGESLADIYGIATFYKAFSLKPRGRHHVSVCLGTACHVRGAPKVSEEFVRVLGIRPGETTEDGEFSLETVNCLGACALGPTVVADGRYFRHVSASKVQGIIDKARDDFGKSDSERNESAFAIEATCPSCGLSLVDEGRGEKGLPSIKLSAAYEGKEYAARLSAFYGNPGAECEGHIPEGALTRLSCPHCGRELPRLIDCPECGTKMAMAAVGKRAALHVCEKRGCPGHMLDLQADTRGRAEGRAE